MPQLGLGLGLGFLPPAKFALTSLSGLQLWADGDTTARPDAVHLTSGNVDTFTDQSDSGHSLLAAGAAQPLWVPSGSGGILRFDGSTDYLKTAAFTLNQPDHVFLVIKPTLAAGALNYMLDGNTVASCGLIKHNTSDVLLYCYAGAYAPNVSPTWGTWMLIDVVHNNASSKIALNGGAQNTGTAGTGNMGGVTLCATAGGLGNFAADLAAVVIFNRALTETERQQVITYLRATAARLGITLP